MVEDTQWHVCSLIVQVAPQDIESVSTTLCAISGTDIPGVNQQEGKIVVVMQGSDPDRLFANIESVRDVAGVLAVSLVYHQQDDLGEEKP